MDSLSHALIGAALYKISDGQISYTDPCFYAMVAGSMAPDLDIVFKKAGKSTYFKNHRGFSHSIPGILTLSGLITFALLPFASSVGIINIFFAALLGNISHILADVLNSYGARVFWPFIKKKIAFNVLVLFDPIIFILLLIIIFGQYSNSMLSANILLTYIAFRIFVKLVLTYRLAKDFNVKIKNVKVMPAVISITKWHFIIRTKDCRIVGQKKLFSKGINIIRRFYDLDDEIREIALSTQVGKFFSNFTPIYSIAHEIKDGDNIFTFTDIRHYWGGSFVHHATVVFDDNYEVKEEVFHPYSMREKIYF